VIILISSLFFLVHFSRNVNIIKMLWNRLPDYIRNNIFQVCFELNMILLLN